METIKEEIYAAIQALQKKEREGRPLTSGEMKTLLLISLLEEGEK